MKALFKKMGAFAPFAWERPSGFKPLLAAFLLPILLGLALSAFRSTRESKTVTILADGKAINFHTGATLVGDAIREAGLEYGPNDLVLPPPKAVIENGGIISVRRIDRRVLNRDTLIEPKTMALPNNRLRVGSEVELRTGMPGLRREVVEVLTIDGQTTEKVLHSQVLVEPVSRKVYRGTRATGNTMAKMTMVATAYTAGAESCWPSVDGKTAVMKRAGYGVAAVDPRVIPLGTRLFIPGYGFAVACDVGGAIRGKRIDLFMDEVRTARGFGKKPVDVYLLD